MPTKAKFEKSPHYQDMIFIGADYHNADTRIKNDGSVIMLHSNGREFEVDVWFDLLIVAFGFNADTLKSEDAKISYLSEGRNNCVQLIEGIKQMMKQANGFCKKYELDYVITKMDALVTMGKTRLEAKLLANQLHTNDNTRDTNSINKKLLFWTTVFAVLATIISGISAWITWEEHKRELNKEVVESQTSILDSTLQVVRSENSLLKSENASLRAKIDSILKLHKVYWSNQ